MFRRILLIGLLGISLVTMLGVEAFGLVCPPNSIKKCNPTCVMVGTCCPYCAPKTGSVDVDVVATQIGNVNKVPVFIGLEVSGIKDAEGNNVPVPWVVACGNPGKKTWMAPGINLVLFDQDLGAETTALSAREVDKNGVARLPVGVIASEVLKGILTLAGACPNPNWQVIDAVPCQMNAKLQEIFKDLATGVCYLESETYFDNCTLDDPVTSDFNECSTLQWDYINKGFEERYYECTTRTDQPPDPIPVTCPTVE